MPHHLQKFTNTLYDCHNTYVSLKYELKKMKGIYE